MIKNIGETDAHRIYGPYIHEKTGKVAWWVIPAHGKKRVFQSKQSMLEFVNTITEPQQKK